MENDFSSPDKKSPQRQSSYTTFSALWTFFGARESQQEIESHEDIDTENFNASPRNSIDRPELPIHHKSQHSTDDLVVPTGLPEKCHPISTILLTYWDNIRGPSIEKYWSDQEKEIDFLLYISKYTLNGEMFRSLGQDIETKFYVLGDLKIAVTSFIFTGYSSHDVVSTYALCIIVPTEYLHDYLAYYPMVLNQIPFMINQFIGHRKKMFAKGFSSSTSLAGKNHISPVDRLATMVVPFAIDLQEILSATLPPIIEIEETIFGSHFENKVDRTILKRILTSFFQTHGCAVIIGNDLNLVNMMIRSLALFLTPVEQKRCCLAKKEIRRYRPGLFLQGFLIQDDIYDELIDANLIQSPYPTTIVDLHQGLVLQGNRYNIFVSIRKEQMVHEVVESDDPLTIPPQDRSLTSLKDCSIFISKMVSEVYRLPHCLRHPYLIQIHRLLTRKAVALIKYVQTEINTDVQTPTELIAKKIQNDFSMDHNLFLMILSTAEKLQPGTYHRVLGDPLSMEDKFREMIDSF